MSDYIDYYFTCHSPFTWFGHDAFIQVANKHNKTINYKPVNLMEVWKASGAVAPPQRAPMRQRHRLIELQRVAAYRGLSVIPEPYSFPTNPERADLCCAVLVRQGKNPGPFLVSVGEALWAYDRQIADEQLLAELLDKAGHDGQAIVAASKQDGVADIRSMHAQEAIEIDVVGVPSYVYRGEVFWGQDRIEYLDHALLTGRDPLTKN